MRKRSRSSGIVPILFLILVSAASIYTMFYYYSISGFAPKQASVQNSTPIVAQTSKTQSEAIKNTAVLGANTLPGANLSFLPEYEFLNSGAITANMLQYSQISYGTNNKIKLKNPINLTGGALCTYAGNPITNHGIAMKPIDNFYLPSYFIKGNNKGEPYQGNASNVVTVPQVAINSFTPDNLAKMSVEDYQNYRTSVTYGINNSDGNNFLRNGGIIYSQLMPLHGESLAKLWQDTSKGKNRIAYQVAFTGAKKNDLYLPDALYDPSSGMRRYDPSYRTYVPVYEGIIADKFWIFETDATVAQRLSGIRGQIASNALFKTNAAPEVEGSNLNDLALNRQASIVKIDANDAFTLAQLLAGNVYTYTGENKAALNAIPLSLSPTGDNSQLCDINRANPSSPYARNDCPYVKATVTCSGLFMNVEVNPGILNIALTPDDARFANSDPTTSYASAQHATTSFNAAPDTLFNNAKKVDILKAAGNSSVVAPSCKQLVNDPSLVGGLDSDQLKQLTLMFNPETTGAFSPFVANATSLMILSKSKTRFAGDITTGLSSDFGIFKRMAWADFTDNLVYSMQLPIRYLIDQDAFYNPKLDTDKVLQTSFRERVLKDSGLRYAQGAYEINCTKTSDGKDLDIDVQYNTDAIN